MLHLAQFSESCDQFKNVRPIQLMFIKFIHDITVIKSSDNVVNGII